MKNKSLIKNKRTIKKRKHKRTIKKRKYKRTIKQRKYKRYGGNYPFTPAQKTAVINEFKERIPKLQEAIYTGVNALDVIVEFYTFILENENILLSVEGFRKTLKDKMNHIENREKEWLDTERRNDYNENLNKLKPTYEHLKRTLRNLLINYEPKVLS